MSTPITHIVVFKLPAANTAEEVRSLCDAFAALKEKCVKEDGSPYLVSCKGGKNMSIEGHEGGMTHAFVVEFASKEDRDYYVKKDQAHAEFAKRLIGSVEGALVIDFVAGEF